jgi:DDE superfamily endonuclease
MRVLRGAASELKAPPGKYYLDNAGYTNSEWILTPFRGVKYHLRETWAVDKRPENDKEMFNLRHSTLRNVVERIIGILKRR